LNSFTVTVNDGVIIAVDPNGMDDYALYLAAKELVLMLETEHLVSEVVSRVVAALKPADATAQAKERIKERLKDRVH
jgi:hypothetical protein